VNWNLRFAQKTKPLLAVLLIFLMGLNLGYVWASGSTILITPQSFVSEASYIIFKDGSTYYARNGTTWAIDYSGTNAAVVTQAAINALPNGGTIFVKSGLYELSQQVTVNSYISLLGEEIGFSGDPAILKGTVFKVQDGADITPFAIASGARNCYLGKFIIDGNRANQTLTSLDGIVGAGSQKVSCVIDDIWFFNIKRHLININSASIMKILNCYGEYWGSDGVECNGLNLVSYSDGWVEENHLGGTNVYGIGSACSLAGGNNYISRNVFSLAPYYGLLVTGDYNRIINNRIEHNGRHDLYVYGGDGNIISGNQFQNENRKTQANAYDFVRLDGSAYDNIVVGNRMYDYSSPAIQVRYAISTTVTVSRTLILHNNLINGYYTKGINSLGTEDIVRQNIGYITENSGTATITASTSVTFNHGLAGTATHVEIGWKTTGYGTWSWSANSTDVTITVTVSGTYSFSWSAEYKP